MKLLNNKLNQHFIYIFLIFFYNTKKLWEKEKEKNERKNKRGTSKIIDSITSSKKSNWDNWINYDKSIL